MNLSTLLPHNGSFVRQIRRLSPAFCVLLVLLLLDFAAYSHGVAEGDKGYIKEISGVNILPFRVSSPNRLGELTPYSSQPQFSTTTYAKEMVFG